MLCNMGYPREASFKFKSREISLVYNTPFSWSIGGWRRVDGEGGRMLCNMGYPREASFEFKSREISLFYNIPFQLVDRLTSCA